MRNKHSEYGKVWIEKEKLKTQLQFVENENTDLKA